MFVGLPKWEYWKTRIDTEPNYYNIGALVADASVPAATLSVQGFGVANPVGDNKTKDGRAENRRAEFTVRFTYSRRVMVPVDQVPMPSTTK